MTDNNSNIYSPLIATYNDERIRLTKRYVAALFELMKAEVEMMKLHDPSGADGWHWGRCHITDLAETNGIDFEYGGKDDDRPETDLLGQFGITVEIKGGIGEND